MATNGKCPQCGKNPDNLYRCTKCGNVSYNWSPCGGNGPVCGAQKRQLRAPSLVLGGTLIGLLCLVQLT